MKKSKRIRTPAVIAIILIAAVTNAMAQSKELEQTLVSLGYKITWRVSAAGADWELRDFNMRSKHVFAIKSKAKVPGEKNMYYRYSVSIEEYPTVADAEKRMDHITATPPGPDSKMVAPEHDLRVGFRRSHRVYVISTDVYTFVVDGSLNKFRLQLDERIPLTRD